MHCGGTVLHVHDYVERVAYGEPRGERRGGSSDAPESCGVIVVRYRCAAEGCRATHRVLPAFLPRHLWYSWRAVEDATIQPAAPAASMPATVATTMTDPPPRRPVPLTILRWLGRLGAAARMLVQLFASIGTVVLTAMVAPLGLDATRGQLVAAYDATMDIEPGRQLSAFAGHVHRLVRGLRLM
jgi:hypothetical protein